MFHILSLLQPDRRSQNNLNLKATLLKRGGQWILTWTLGSARNSDRSPFTLHPSPFTLNPVPWILTWTQGLSRARVGRLGSARSSDSTPAPCACLLQVLGLTVEEGRCKPIWKRGIQTLMAQGRSTKIISMMKWIRTSRLSTKNSF